MNDILLPTLIGIFLGAVIIFAVDFLFNRLKSKDILEKKAKEPLKKRTKFTILSMIMIISYTVAVLIFSWMDKEVPSELTVSWFAAWTTELALLFGIRIKDKE